MVEKHELREFKVSFHDIQLFAAFLFFLLIPLKNTGIIHYVIWLGVIATTANIALTIYNNGAERKYIVLFFVLLIDIVVSLFTTDEPFESGLLYAIVCYFSLFWVIALNNTFLQNKKTIDTVYRFGILSGLLFSAFCGNLHCHDLSKKCKEKSFRCYTCYVFVVFTMDDRRKNMYDCGYICSCKCNTACKN